jgi:hypothetical protein
MSAAHSKDKGKHVEKHVEVKKPLVKGKAPDKVVAPVADAKGKVVELKAAQKLAAARAAAAAGPRLHLPKARRARRATPSSSTCRRAAMCCPKSGSRSSSC